jgi:hypothetical protein
MPLPSQTFPNFNALLNYINTQWIPNGTGNITGDIGNNVVNGLLTFIEQSSINYSKVHIVSIGGAVVIPSSNPTLLISGTTPSSVTWQDNIYNEIVIINTLPVSVPLLSGTVYYDTSLIAQNFIPAGKAIRLLKSTNNLWVTDGGGGAKLPLIGIAGTGGQNDPVVNSSLFESSLIIGLGSANSGRYKIEVNKIAMYNFGAFPDFVVTTPSVGLIDITPMQFRTGDTIYIDLNQ